MSKVTVRLALEIVFDMNPGSTEEATHGLVVRRADALQRFLERQLDDCYKTNRLGWNVEGTQ